MWTRILLAITLLIVTAAAARAQEDQYGTVLYLWGIANNSQYNQPLLRRTAAIADLGDICPQNDQTTKKLITIFQSLLKAPHTDLSEKQFFLYNVVLALGTGNLGPAGRTLFADLDENFGTNPILDGAIITTKGKIKSVTSSPCIKAPPTAAWPSPSTLAITYTMDNGTPNANPSQTDLKLTLSGLPAGRTSAILTFVAVESNNTVLTNLPIQFTGSETSFTIKSTDVDAMATYIINNKDKTGLKLTSTNGGQTKVRADLTLRNETSVLVNVPNYLTITWTPVSTKK